MITIQEICKLNGAVSIPNREAAKKLYDILSNSQLYLLGFKNYWSFYLHRPTGEASGDICCGFDDCGITGMMGVWFYREEGRPIFSIEEIDDYKIKIDANDILNLLEG